MTDRIDRANTEADVPSADGPTLHHIAERVLNRPILMHPDKVDQVLSVLQGRLPISAAGAVVQAPEASRFVGTAAREGRQYGLSRATGGVAIISIVGSLVNRGAWIGASSGLTSYEGLMAQVRDAAADPEIHTILLDIDSPGGEATGMFAAAELIREVAKTKNVVAMVNDVAASAAYGLASAARQIVVSPTSVVGSIGVVLTHLDRSGELNQKGIAVTLIYAGAHKVDGHPFGALSKAVTADLQAQVEQFYTLFLDTVAAGRGGRLSAEQARATEARVFLGAEAVRLGLADRVASFDATMADLIQNRGAGAPQKRSMTMSGQPNGGTPNAENNGITQEAHAAGVAAARAEGEKAGAASGIAAERARIGAILDHAEAKDRPSLARSLALETDMTAEAAGVVMAKAAKESGSGGGSIADAAKGMAEFGADSQGGGAPDKTKASDAVWGAASKMIGIGA